MDDGTENLILELNDLLPFEARAVDNDRYASEILQAAIEYIRKLKEGSGSLDMGSEGGYREYEEEEGEREWEHEGEHEEGGDFYYEDEDKDEEMVDAEG